MKGDTNHELVPSRQWVAQRDEIGSAGHRFVEDWHDPLKVARLTIDMYRGSCAA